MTATKASNQGGSGYLQASTIDANGYWTGTAGTSPAADTTSHARLFRHAVEESETISSPERLRFRRGDTNGYGGQMSFGGGETEEISITAEAKDADLEAMFLGNLVDTTSNSEWVITSTRGRVDVPAIGFIFSYPVQSVEAATKGVTMWENRIILASTVRVLRGNITWRAASNRTFVITPTISGRMPHGVPFGANQSYEDNETDVIEITTYKPLGFTAYIGDGTETEFITGYRPTSTVVTNGANRNWFARQGAAQALTSISATTGVAVMAAAGSSGNRNLILYETIFTAI